MSDPRYSDWTDEMKCKFLDQIYLVMSKNILMDDSARPIKGTSKRGIYDFIYYLQLNLGSNIVSFKEFDNDK